jgi:hypothetical protein
MLEIIAEVEVYLVRIGLVVLLALGLARLIWMEVRKLLKEIRARR